MSDAAARTGMTDRTVEGIREVLSGRMRWHQPAVVRRSRGDRLDRLHGPRQFRDQHPGRREIRLCAAVGRAAGQCHRHAVPGAFGQARHRHRAQSRRNVPRAFSAARRLCACGSSAKWRRWRPISPNSSAARSVFRYLLHYPLDRRHGRHRRADLRHPDVRRTRVSPDRNHHRRLGRRHRPLLSRRNVHRADRLGRGGVRQRCSAIAGRQRRDDRGRHRRRDHHAACDLPAFRPHPEPGAGAQR